MRGGSLVTFEPDGDGSRVTLHIHPEGAWAAIAARILAFGAVPGSYRRLLRSFARRAERERLSRLII
jgi:hypothetical protein